jgi:hypothetical protein
VVRPRIAVSLLLVAALGLCGCSSGDSDLEGAKRETEAAGGVESAGEAAVQTTLPPIRFYREYVTVVPSPGSTSVSAIYYFRNESDRSVRQGIAYPFPVDRTHLYPSVIRVWEKTGSGLRPMGYVRRGSNVLWEMDVEAGGTKVIRVDYTQEIREPRAIYIVTTTQRWERPIELAEFEFRVPAELGEHRLSFEPDSSVTSGDTTVHYVAYEDFMPDEDLTVTWME